MDKKMTRSSRHQLNSKQRNSKKAASVIGTSLIFLPIAGNLLPLGAQATEYEQQEAVSEQAFIDSIGYSAASVASSNDLYASVMIAQALLESSYGTSGLASAPNYNLFGVKGSYGGQTVYMPTKEYLNGEWVTLTEPFRSYPSYADSFQDHANVLMSAHYAGAWRSNTTSYMDATAALTGRYATDPNYADKLNWLISTYGLTAYDWGSSETSVTATDQSTIGQSTETATISGQSYTVASGDTLWGIAENFGVSVDQLMAMNGLSAELITVGQTLQV
ncbi:MULTISPECIES: glucosaminidase domain-containing protein [unclassified Enterococcus]|uniref:glucosaminidase domain-containing protein n=1 Tax=unclassified Enterococcus TaxID=2608891 RepID=UPI001CE200D6|nr:MULTISPECIES: glucosaminidase domain-containing protein [unclassified Enterococcus]MCA5012825.1 glucosaminidase domain-containing protein [Enterococcus sp. S23]MCA5016076.1 glucosaminidase domain-containing protein [Enterococcus sp. S22(2020)]